MFLVEFLSWKNKPLAACQHETHIKIHGAIIINTLVVIHYVWFLKCRRGLRKLPKSGGLRIIVKILLGSCEVICMSLMSALIHRAGNIHLIVTMHNCIGCHLSQTQKMEMLLNIDDIY